MNAHVVHPEWPADDHVTAEGRVDYLLERYLDMVGHGGEVVVNWNQLSGIGAAVMALAGVPGMNALSPSMPTITPARSGSGDRGGDGGGDIRIESLSFRMDAGRLLVEGARTRDGRRVIIETVHDVDYEGGR